MTFLLKTTDSTIRTELRLDPNADLPDFNGRFVPYTAAPAVVAQGSGQVLKLMNFSLVPSWSKTPKVKFATHNARLDTILEKPTWRGPFVKKHALVPMTDFVESITTIGKTFAGNMVRIHELNSSLMVAAAIYDEWMNPETGELLESFAILTDEPPDFIRELGHDRCPVFIRPEFYSEWLHVKGDGPANLALLAKARRPLDFAVVVDRPLKPGWEKRAK